MQTEFPIMGSSAKLIPIDNRLYTEEEYLAFEQAELDRHFFVDGRIFAQESVSWDHGAITVNLIASLGIQVKRTPYHLRAVATKVYSGPKIANTLRSMFWYPDIVVIGAGTKYYDPKTDVVLNPKAIVEIISPFTEALDRGEKFVRLQACNPNLTDYIIVSQDKPQIEHFEKLAEGPWMYNFYEGLDGTVPLTAIGCMLNLADVYDRVVFADI